MATGPAEMMLRFVIVGSLSLNDMDIERRPYHKYCSCALHKSKDTYACTCLQHGSISYPRKQQWQGCRLSFVVSNNSSHTSFPCDSKLMAKDVLWDS